MSLIRELNRNELFAIMIGILAVSVALIRDFGVIGVLFVIISFLLHELGHRQSARMNGCIGRFILDPFGLLLTLISSVLPVKFLAPGYVGVFCVNPSSLTYRAQLEINSAGIAINLLLASTSLVLALVLRINELFIFSLINSWLAFFNLIPVGPLDGAKIFSLNKKLWALAFIASLIMLVNTML